ncbi:2-acyl-glycerophospho-ethanolamine acyltransferase [Clavibacter michiganensis]|uniref:2-acyl-glycerophospho-ethanolamine acyltransferase n=1 Tax=Clavibacter michiganensis TaxID=28447 RepID=A0A251Y5P0_9MICO|nr:MFS transporter [Clavibacter michiganensis]OUE19308.1 2-acyl-glycerophospho-ethanolamine acyltransferase [Clavibacter michiganensis]
MTGIAARPLSRLARDRRSRVYLGGQIVSIFGDTALFLSAAVWVRELTGSDGAAASTFLFLAAPALASPFVGVLVDRVRRKPLLVVVNAVTGAAVLLLLLVRDSGDVGLVYAVMTLYGAASTIIASAQSALLPAIVPEDLLGDANGLLQTVQQGARVLSPLVGVGLFTAFGGGVVAVVDAVSFAVAVVSLLLIRVDEPTPSARDRTVSMRADIGAGFARIRLDPALRVVVVACAWVWAAFGLAESVVFAVVSQGLGLEPSFLAATSSLQGAGALVGGVLSARLIRWRGELRIAGGASATLAAGFLLWMLPAVPAVLLGSFVLGAALPPLVVGSTTLIQRRSPERLRGRVYSAFDMALTVPQTAAIAVGASLVAHVPYRAIIIVMCVVLAGAATALMRAGSRVDAGPLGPGRAS